MYKIIAFVAVVLAGVFVAPMAASAVPYTPGAVISANPVNLHPGGTSVISAGAGYFGNSESVTVTVSGPGATTTAFRPAAVSDGWTVPSSLTSTSAGAVSFALTAPAGSHGSYTVGLSSASASGSVVLNVTTATSGGSGSNPGGGSGTTIASTGGGLAFTGLSFPMMLIWAIAAIIALGAALITVRRIKQRERTSH